MRKTILAAALAAVFATPALAQTPSAQLYGRLNLGVDSYKADGAAAGPTRDFGSRMRVYDVASRVGVRGTEDLGGGWRALFQIETGVNVDNGSNTGQNGIVNPSTGFWSTRDSYAGIEGDRFGRLTFGRQSIYWFSGTINQVGANYLNTAVPFSSVNLSGIMLGPAQRESNAVQYSARLGGFSGTVSYALPGTSTAVSPLLPGGPSEQVQGGRDAKEHVWGATLRYNHAMFDLQADWATRYDTNQVDGRDFSGWKLGGAWKYLPGAQISLIGQRVKNKNTNGIGLLNYASPAAPVCGTSLAAGNAALGAALQAGIVGNSTLGGGGAVNTCDTLTQTMWVLQWEHTFGNVQAIAEYGQAGDVKGSSAAAGLPDSKARAWTLGARYLMSKRTWLYASYSEISNGRNAYNDYWGGWVTSASQLNIGAGNLAPGLPSVSSGADPRIFAVGIFHAF